MNVCSPGRARQDAIRTGFPLYTAGMRDPDPLPTPFPATVSRSGWLRRWWGGQSPTRQDRFAMLAPVAAILLFLAAIVSSFWYLRLEEVDREQEAVKRDLEYAQQRLRLRLLERQEQLMRLARDISNKEVDPEEFMGRAETRRLGTADRRRSAQGRRHRKQLQPRARFAATRVFPAYCRLNSSSIAATAHAVDRSG